MTSHLDKRYIRYFVNTQTNSFNSTLKGLTVIELNITELCTRACSFCPRADNKVYKNQKLFMSLDTVVNIVNNCKKYDYNGDFHICGFGEPTTNKYIVEIIHCIRKELDNRIALTTNGDLLNVELARQLLEAGLTYIIISCYDGPESRDRIIKILLEAGFSHEQYDIRELWFKQNETHEEFLTRNTFNNRGGSVQDKRVLDVQTSPCFLPFYKLVIDWDGRVLLCCNDWLKLDNKLGNINSSTLHDIWYGDAIKSIREKLVKGERKNILSCKNCNVNGTLVGDLSVKVLT